MRRKAQSAHVTGGRVFGYRNVEVFTDMVDANGRPQRSHVERQIDDTEAPTVRRIFELSAAGHGMRAIAAMLNDEHAPSPRAQQGRPKGWAPSSVREVLMRDLYRGQIVWNKTRKRDQWGRKHQKGRPETEWMRVSAPHLRIVTDDAWQAAHARLDASRRTYLRGTQGERWGRPPAGTTAEYLLTGLARCGVCGGGVIVRSRAHGRKRSFRYGCYCYHVKGRAVCDNKLEVLLDKTDAAILNAIKQDVVNSRVIETAVRHALNVLADQHAGSGQRRQTIEAALRDVDAELDHLIKAIAYGGESSQVLVGAVREREQRRADLQAELAGLTEAPAARMDRRSIEKQLRARA